MSRFDIIDVEQRSPEWLKARTGRVTGSRAPMMMETIKSGAFSAERENLRFAIALEMLRGKPYERIFKKPRVVEHGELTEVFCADRYEVLTGNLIDRTGFLAMKSVAAGCSLDGHVNDFEGIVEFKCPESATHWKYLETQKIPDEYYFQCIHNMWVSGAKWCDFVSYDPDYPEELQFALVRLERNEAVMKSYELALTLFLSECKEKLKEMNDRLKERREKEAA